MSLVNPPGAKKRRRTTVQAKPSKPKSYQNASPVKLGNKVVCLVVEWMNDAYASHCEFPTAISPDSGHVESTKDYVNMALGVTPDGLVYWTFDIRDCDEFPDSMTKSLQDRFAMRKDALMGAQTSVTPESLARIILVDLGTRLVEFGIAIRLCRQALQEAGKKIASRTCRLVLCE